MPLDAAGVLWDSKHALHTADDAARHASNRPADGPAHWTGRTVTDSCPLLGSTDNSLRMTGTRQSKNGEADRGK
ncbi:hypothetical protein [Microvirga sp. TS319]|uniref:hypothetical protein n=1 Tax=Microvirga sp. TS319 TaxID=3241165 RepID=UPI00351A47B7